MKTPTTRNILAEGVVASIATLIIRQTVFTEDCNLLVVTMTFLAAFAIAIILLCLIRFFRMRI